MNTSENMNPIAVDRLPELPAGFNWRITATQSSADETVVQTRLWLESNTGKTIVAWVNVQKDGKWIQNPTLEQLMVHAEGILEKTSTRWVLNLPTVLEKPSFM